MMKTLTLVLVLFWTASFNPLAANALGQPSPCEDGCAVAHILEQKLPEGIWQGTDEWGTEVTLQFHSNGLLQWSAASSEGQDQQLLEWAAVPGSDGCAYLQFIDLENRNVDRFSVVAHEQSLFLVSQGLQVRLQMKPVEAAAISAVRKGVIGQWGNTTYPLDLPSEAPDQAYLRYRFMPNGQFERQLSNGTRSLTERGQWTVSKDGQHLVLQLEDGSTTLAALKYLEMDQMVLQHVLSCQDPLLASDQRSFFFNRD